MAGNLGSALLRFSVSLVLAKLLLPAQWGYLVIFITLMDIVAVFCDSGINPALVKFIASQKESDPGPIIGRCTRVKIALCALVLVVLAAMYVPFMRIQDIPSTYSWVYLVAALSGIVLSFHTYALSIIQALQKYVSYSVLALSVNALRALGVVSVAAMGFRSERALFLSFFLPLAFAVMLAAYSSQYLVKRSVWKPAKPFTQRALLSFMLPLATMNVISILIQRVDIFMLQSMTTPAVVGAYGLAFQIAFVFPLITSAMFIALLPKVSSMTTASALSLYRRRIISLYPVIIVGTVVAVVAAPPFLNLLFEDKYAAAVPILQLLLLAFGLHIIFNPLGLIFYSLNQPHILTIIHAVQLPLLVMINVLLIPRYGAIGATLAALLIRIFGVAAVVWLTSRALKRLSASELAAEV